MAETCAERLQRLINEQRNERRAKSAAKQAQVEAEKLTTLSTFDVDAEMAQLDTEMNSLTDAELKEGDRRHLQEKLIKAKELEEEKNRRSGG
jgi:hypothetical protein